MTPAELERYRDEIAARHVTFIERAERLDFASSEVESTDHDSDALAESLFLRYFAAYEVCLEHLFLHYVSGGTSVAGAAPTSYLNVPDADKARKVIRAGNRFLSWAKAATVRETSTTYLQEGWPFNPILSAQAQELADCEKIRNRIAHHSMEALQDFAGVQRNLLQTERLFTLTAGQLLRIRHRQKRQPHIIAFAHVMHDTLMGVIDPSP